MDKNMNKDDKIYFTLDRRTPETLYARYKGRSAKVMVDIVPANMEDKILLYDERIINSEKYLRTILYANNNSQIYEPNELSII
jgi:hypothetical protein